MATRSKKASSSRRPAPRQVGYAVVGLGHIAQNSVLPAFANARKNSRLVALVSSDAAKRRRLARQYDVEATFGYDEFDACMAHPEVDAVYIALPNDMHEEYTVRAARAGVHVLCEKPMALEVGECERMIRTCEENDVRLMIAYRLHFEPSNLYAVELVREGRIGAPRFFSSTFSYQVKRDNIRTRRERGGGALWDIGIYCLNASRMLFQAEPEEVYARWLVGRDARFEEVPAGVGVLLRFPDDRLAQFTCSFDAAPSGDFEVVGEKGRIRLENAYDYEGERVMHLTVGERTRVRRFKELDQFGPELFHFSQCVLEGRQPEPDGREGLADVRALRAIERSAHEGRPVHLPPFEKRRRPTAAQQLQMRPVRPAAMERVEAPSH